jgi:pectin methylesterase-like acyl-CoA thioesterase
VYFDACEFHTVGRSGVMVQARNAPGAYGYVFVGAKLTADAQATNNLLARIDASVYPGSQAAFVDCQMTNVGKAGFTITGATPTSALRFWEYGSTDASGNPLDLSGRVNGSTRISSDAASKLRDPSAVLGGWQPPR